MRAKNPLLTLQKQIYHSLQRETETLLGKPEGVLAKYEKSYHAAIRKRIPRARECAKRELLAEIPGSRILLIGDFHPYHQSQRAALRLLKEIQKRFPRRPIILGMEVFSTEFQRELDLFSRGRISETELLKRTEFDERWGFPWQHFLPLLEYARDNRIRLLALNRPGGVLPPLPVLKSTRPYGDLGARDEWTAGVLVDTTREHPEALVLALFGEYHLAPSHLPARITELARRNSALVPGVLTVYQNIDELYWKIRERTNPPRSNLFRLGPREFCHFSGTPWTKIQALVNWIHGDPALFSDEELDPRSEFLSWMQTYGTMIAKFFQVPVPSFEGIDVHGLDFGLPRLNAKQMKELLHLLQAQERIYERWYEHAWVFAPSLSENSAAELATIHLRMHSKEKVFPLKLDSPAELAERIVDHAVGFMGSLLMNPRRKCDHLRDHEAAVRRLKKFPREALFPGELQVRSETIRVMKRTLHLKEITARELVSTLESVLSALKDRRQRFSFTRFLGHWMGQLVHDEVLLGEIPIEKIRPGFTPEMPLRQLNEILEWAQKAPRERKLRSRNETL